MFPKDLGRTKRDELYKTKYDLKEEMEPMNEYKNYSPYSKIHTKIEFSCTANLVTCRETIFVTEQLIR
jgi:hypothetical protein